jgi:GTP-binding protein HflX
MPCWWGWISGRAWFDAELEELASLATSAATNPWPASSPGARRPHAALFVGSGKAEEIKALVAGRRRRA